MDSNPYVPAEEVDFVEQMQQEDVDPSRVQLVSAASRDLIETPRLTAADFRAVVPDSHNYR